MPRKTTKTPSKPKAAKTSGVQSTASQPVEPTPIQRPASPEEQAQIQLQQQRGRAEVAVLKQRFAETDVAMTIAQAECGQLVQQNQALQQENARLKEEITALKNPKDDASNEGAAPDSEEN